MIRSVPIAESPVRHTYPYGRTDVVLEVSDSSTEELITAVRGVFAENSDCRRIVVPVAVGDDVALEQVEEAKLRYVLEVELREGTGVYLFVAEPDWVMAQSTDIIDLDLS